MTRPSSLVSILITIFLVAATAPPAQAHPPVGDPYPAFVATLPLLNRRAEWGEDYALTEVGADGFWAYAIAEPIPGSSFVGRDAVAFKPHRFVPLIGIWESGAWQVVIPSPANAAEFNLLLDNLPTTLMDEATKAFVRQPVPRSMPHTERDAAGIQQFSGHKLPWPKGLIAWAFSKDASGHLHQVDFDIQGLAAAGEVVASKPGTVVFVKESSSSGACSFSAWRQTNMVVVQHAADEYSWYVHLAFDSVPVNVGDVVGYGTRLGIEGDTGFACGKHVHYMVSSGHTTWTDPADPNAAPWATGLAPTDFVEVPWAGIINRRTYISQNDDAPPPLPPCPAPQLQTPADGFVAAGQTLIFAWSGLSRCAFDGYVLRVKTVPDMTVGGTVVAEATTNAPTHTLSISPTWNYRDLHWSVRANGDGATWAAPRRLRIEPPVTGTYALYNAPNFIGDVFTGSQTITDLQAIGLNNWAHSLTLDAGVGIVACSDAEFRGACGRAVGPAQFSTLDALAPELSGRLSSIRVCGGECPPSPRSPTLTWPITGQIVLSSTVITLQWVGNDEGEQYRGELSGGGLSETIAFGWITDTRRTIGVLPPSESAYAWRLRASNGFGDSGWVGTQFIVRPAQNIYAPLITRGP